MTQYWIDVQMLYASLLPQPQKHVILHSGIARVASARTLCWESAFHQRTQQTTSPLAAAADARLGNQLRLCVHIRCVMCARDQAARAPGGHCIHPEAPAGSGDTSCAHGARV